MKTLHFTIQAPNAHLQDFTCLRISLWGSQTVWSVASCTYSQLSGLLCTQSPPSAGGGGGEFCISFDESKTLQQSGGIIMGATSPAVAGSYGPRCGATADRMELNPVWALRVKAVTMRIFYGELSDISAVHHEVCPQQSGINYKRSMRVARMRGGLQNM